MSTQLQENMYLKPQDLRIGNYINYEQTTHVVAELHNDKLIHHWLNHPSDGYVTKYNQILSIPLTRMELERLGFEENEELIIDQKAYLDDSNFFVESVGDDYWLSEFVNKSKITRYVKIDFVHELQNMYYYLTKEELKYEK